MKSPNANSKGTATMRTLASLAFLCLLHCDPSATGDKGDAGQLNAAPGDDAPALDPNGFASIVTATLPGGSPERQQAYARVDATSLMVRTKPRRDAKAVHRLENQAAVEVLEEDGETRTIDGATGRWTKIRAIVVEKDRPSLLTGWVFGGYLTKSSDGEYQTGPAAGDHAPVWKMRPADYPFDPRGNSFSYGVGCSGATFSEYGLEMDFHSGPGSNTLPLRGPIAVSSNNAIIHDSESPSGKICSTIERTTYRGEYTIKGGAIRVRFTKREDESERFGEEEPDDCAKTDKNERPVDLADEYVIAYCYLRGATVPGIIATIPGDDADRIPTFWALIEN